MTDEEKHCAGGGAFCHSPSEGYVDGRRWVHGWPFFRSAVETSGRGRRDGVFPFPLRCGAEEVVMIRRPRRGHATIPIICQWVTVSRPYA